MQYGWQIALFDAMKITDASFRELVFFRSFSGLRAEAARYYLGFAWWIIEPILFMIALYVVFAVLLQRGTEDFVVFLLVGIVTWQWFAGVVRHSAASIWSAGAIMTQVRVPKLFFPAVTIFMDTAKFFVAFFLLVTFIWFYGIPPGPAYPALFFVLLVQFLFIAAAALLVAMAVPFLPDLRFAVESLLHFLFFFSGIFFDVNTVPKDYQWLIQINPMTQLIDAHRAILIHGIQPSWSSLLWIGSVSVIMLIFLALVLTRMDQVYPRLIKI